MTSDVPLTDVLFNDVALDRLDIDLVWVEMITLVVLEDAALLKDDQVIILALLTDVVPLEVVVDGTENEEAVSVLHEVAVPLEDEDN